MSTLSWKIARDTRALFCPQCSAILGLPDMNNKVECGDCDYSLDAAALATDANIQTQVKNYNHQAELEDKNADPTSRRATVEEPCPNCAFHQMTYWTVQMRSVDEAASVFFECSQCGYTYKQAE